MVSCRHTNTCQVFSGGRAVTFLGEKQVQKRWEAAEEEPIYLNPVWVSSRPWTS